MNSNFRNFVIWVFIALLLVALFNLFQTPGVQVRGNEISFSQMLSEVEGGNVQDVTIAGNQITGHFTDGRNFQTYAPDDPNLVDKLDKKGVKITAKPSEEDVPSLFGVLISWFPMLLLIAVWIFFMRQMQSGGGRAMGFGKSKAKLLTERHGRVTFDDVAGVNEAKEDLQEIVEFLRDPQKFQKLGGKIPRGALLVGPPGTGKTLLARAIAGEANVPFFTISGSDFVEMFVGVGASRVRDMFDQAKKNAPCIIFIDEIDAVGRHRGAGLGGGNDEREQTLNQLLVEMDGFEANEGVILIAATNRPDVLDPALLRPGRFDRQVVVPRPDIIGREKILKVHVRKVPLAPDVDLRVIARGTPGFSGADLANLVNEAALLAARRSKRVVTQHEFEDAKDKVMMGAERRSMVMTEEEKTLTAYHEGGHALVTLHQPASDPVHKATIIPRGRALGMVMRLPERDMLSYTRAKLKADITVAMGGRVAEEIVFGYDKVTSGASSDIKMATGLARAMVTQFGMSDKLGPLAYGDNEEEVFLGHSVSRTQSLSDETQTIVDEEIHRLVDEGFETARKILSENIDDLHIVARGLLEYETLSGQEIKDLLNGKPPVRDFPVEDTIRPGPASAVPTAGRGKKPPEPETGPGGMEPQPT
ncbi:MAG TPA: ATP-dependent zinc metalloprotease FtsH [Methyloceanibacter sp.]|nr:ATP-dependent zinc metalloprotease FtsH [Methyloceanibacter sp.]